MSYRRVDVYVLLASAIIRIRNAWFLLDRDSVVFLLGSRRCTVPAPVTRQQHGQKRDDKDRKGNDADHEGPEHPHGGEGGGGRHAGIGLPQALGRAGVTIAALGESGVGIAARLAHPRGGVHAEPPDADGALRGRLARTAEGLALQADGRVRVVPLRAGRQALSRRRMVVVSMSAREALLLVARRAVPSARDAATFTHVEARGRTRCDAREVRDGEQVAGPADAAFGGRGAALAVRRTREALALVLEGPGRACAYAMEVVEHASSRAREAMVFGRTHARVARAVTVVTDGSVAVRVGRALAGARAQVERVSLGTAQALIWMGAGARETGAVAGCFLAFPRLLVRYGVGRTGGNATAIRSQEEPGVALGARATEVALRALLRRARLALLRVQVKVLSLAARLRTAAVLRNDAQRASSAVVVAVARVAVMRARLARVGRLVFKKAPGTLAHAQLDLLVAVLDPLAL